MFDLESLSLRPRAMVLSIGAVEFDPANGLGREFYQELNLQDQYKLARDVNPDTVTWWMQQAPDAKVVFKSELEGGFARTKHAVVNALMHFTSFLADIGGGGKLDELWSRGYYDEVWLASLCEDAGIKRPWAYGAPKDCRTLDSLTRGVVVPERTGTFHNALDDAKYQALCAIAQMNHLGVK